MKIKGINNLIRKDLPIYYRRLYSGIVVVEFMDKITECHIDFIVETKPTGLNEIIISQLDNVEYPLIPLKKEIIAFITQLDATGGLPA